MLTIKARVGDIIQIGEGVTVRIAAKESQWVGLQFQAARSIPITRFGGQNPDVLQKVETRQLAETKELFKFGGPATVAIGINRPIGRRLKAREN